MRLESASIHSFSYRIETNHHHCRHSSNRQQFGHPWDEKDEIVNASCVLQIGVSGHRLIVAVLKTTNYDTNAITADAVARRTAWWRMKCDASIATFHGGVWCWYSRNGVKFVCHYDFVDQTIFSGVIGSM